LAVLIDLLGGMHVRLVNVPGATGQQEALRGQDR
jgi:hypothetical protein